jgi:hypothetical protein
MRIRNPGGKDRQAVPVLGTDGEVEGRVGGLGGWIPGSGVAALVSRRPAGGVQRLGICQRQQQPNFSSLFLYFCGVDPDPL